MKRQILGVFATLAVVLMLSSAARAFATPCAKLSLSATPTTVKPGGTITISGSITNCSSSPELVKLDYTVTGPLNSKYMGDLFITLQPGQTRSASFTHTVPDNIPPGTYTLTVNAYSGGILVATAQAKVTVTLF